MRGANLSPRFWVASTLIVLLVLVAVLGPLVVGTGPREVVGGLYDRPSTESLALVLGTDNQGQSVLANLVHGLRTSLLVGLLAGSIATVIGLVLGLIAGFQGGLVDDVINAVTNIALAIPTIVVIILLGVALGSRSSVALAVIIGVTAWPWLARAVRAQSSSIRAREHIEVARLSGARWVSILGWDVLPYLLSYVVMAFVLQCSGAILAEATLSLLGLGPSGSTSIGTMLYWAQVWGSVRVGALWAFLPPTIVLTLISFSLLLLNSAGDELFNPRLRKGRRARRRGRAEGLVTPTVADPVARPGGAAR
ncbi:ABC transporter permease [Desertihabitans brevis]|uniref:ABC transporter permease n=1 Tax=Desertihabitans brevis TaxID=2268447 RepID=A0A367YT53_9ACTN|nr:ABC transporter permease [Desertihabitans brevis]RCK68988.1 ABC transporter permease [Desertihabitans brevis]